MAFCIYQTHLSIKQGNLFNAEKPPRSNLWNWLLMRLPGLQAFKGEKAAYVPPVSHCSDEGIIISDQS